MMSILRQCCDMQWKVKRLKKKLFLNASIAFSRTKWLNRKFNFIYWLSFYRFISCSERLFRSTKSISTRKSFHWYDYRGKKNRFKTYFFFLTTFSSASSKMRSLRWLLIFVHFVFDSGKWKFISCMKTRNS